MAHEHIELRNGGYYIAGTRISLDSIVYLYRDGAPPEAIQDDLPSLNLEQIQAAIAFYLANLKTVDENIVEGERELDRVAPPLEIANPELHARLQRARHELKR